MAGTTPFPDPLDASRLASPAKTKNGDIWMARFPSGVARFDLVMNPEISKTSPYEAVDSDGPPKVFDDSALSLDA